MRNSWFNGNSYICLEHNLLDLERGKNRIYQKKKKKSIFPEMDKF